MRSRKVLVALVLLGCSKASGDGPPIGHMPGDAPDAAAAVDAAFEPQEVRFVLMGDTGTASEGQYAVADAIEQKCAADGCDFVVLLGDNIYDSGVSSTEDAQWQEKFEAPYAKIDLPFYAVLGNHDYGGYIGIPPVGYESGGLGNEWDKGPIEVQYSNVSSKWVMPDTHYTLKVGNVGFIMLDTNSILWDNDEHGDQRSWYPTALAEVEGSDWIFAAAHHPYLSNGAHGNAGDYESIEIGNEEIEIISLPVPIEEVRGDHVKSFFDEVICGTVDIVVSGHDHNRQWLNEPEAVCGAELIVSGAGAKVKDFKPRGNETHYQDADKEGFLYMVVKGKTLTGQFIDSDGVVNFERTLSK